MYSKFSLGQLSRQKILIEFLYEYYLILLRVFIHLQMSNFQYEYTHVQKIALESRVIL